MGFVLRLAGHKHSHRYEIKIESTLLPLLCLSASLLLCLSASTSPSSPPSPPLPLSPPCSVVLVEVLFYPTS